MGTRPIAVTCCGDQSNVQLPDQTLLYPSVMSSW
jgi:hypothetical protein